MPFNGGGSSGEEQWGGAGVGVVPRGGGGRGGLVRCPDDAVARQRPDPSESGWAAHACTAGAKQGRPESPTSGLRATVTSGAGQKWFKLQNSNGLKMFKFFQILIDANLSFPAPKIEIKYGFEDIGKMNNFLHRNFFRFGSDLE
jgi:hypothetical protein